MGGGRLVVVSARHLEFAAFAPIAWPSRLGTGFRIVWWRAKPRSPRLSAITAGVDHRDGFADFGHRQLAAQHQWSDIASGRIGLAGVAGVVALSLWLFTSAGSPDLTAIYESIVRRAEYIEVGEQNPIGRFRGRFGPVATWRRYQARREDVAKQQRLRETMEREHREADDASRVDEILQRLHQDGVESLSQDERELLQRVSEALKNERQNIARDIDSSD